MTNSIFSTCKEYMIKKLPHIQKHFYKLQIRFIYNSILIHFKNHILNYIFSLYSKLNHEHEFSGPLE